MRCPFVQTINSLLKSSALHNWWTAPSRTSQSTFKQANVSIRKRDRETVQCQKTCISNHSFTWSSLVVIFILLILMVQSICHLLNSFQHRPKKLPVLLCLQCLAHQQNSHQQDDFIAPMAWCSFRPPYRSAELKQYHLQRNHAYCLGIWLHSNSRYQPWWPNGLEALESLECWKPNRIFRIYPNISEWWCHQSLRWFRKLQKLQFSRSTLKLKAWDGHQETSSMTSRLPLFMEHVAA